MRNVSKLLGLSYSPRMKEGFKYTPQYDHDHLDPSVVSRDVESYDLWSFDSKACEIYSRLYERARSAIQSQPETEIGR